MSDFGAVHAGMSRPRRISKRPLKFGEELAEAGAHGAQVVRGGNPPSKRHNKNIVRDGETSVKGCVGAGRPRIGGADLPVDNGVTSCTLFFSVALSLVLSFSLSVFRSFCLSLFLAFSLSLRLSFSLSDILLNCSQQ